MHCFQGLSYSYFCLQQVNALLSCPYPSQNQRIRHKRPSSDHSYYNPSRFLSMVVGMAVGRSTDGGKADALHCLPEKAEASFRVALNLAFRISGAHGEDTEVIASSSIQVSISTVAGLRGFQITKHKWVLVVLLDPAVPVIISPRFCAWPFVCVALL